MRLCFAENILSSRKITRPAVAYLKHLNIKVLCRLSASISNNRAYRAQWAIALLRSSCVLHLIHLEAADAQTDETPPITPVNWIKPAVFLFSSSSEIHISAEFANTTWKSNQQLPTKKKIHYQLKATEAVDLSNYYKDTKNKS